MFCTAWHRRVWQREWGSLSNSLPLSLSLGLFSLVVFSFIFFSPSLSAFLPPLALLWPLRGNLRAFPPGPGFHLSQRPEFSQQPVVLHKTQMTGDQRYVITTKIVLFCWQAREARELTLWLQIWINKTKHLPSSQHFALCRLMHHRNHVSFAPWQLLPQPVRYLRGTSGKHFADMSQLVTNWLHW